MKLYLDKDVLGGTDIVLVCEQWWKKNEQKKNRQKHGVFYCLRLLFGANGLVKSFEMCDWQFQYVWKCFSFSHTQRQWTLYRLVEGYWKKKYRDIS